MMLFPKHKTKGLLSLECSVTGCKQIRVLVTQPASLLPINTCMKGWRSFIKKQKLWRRGLTWDLFVLEFIRAGHFGELHDDLS